MVILAWNAWSETEACLNSLRPTLGIRDEVIVVDNGSTDQTAAALRRYPWVRVVTNTVNRGFAGGCNDGASVASKKIVVFLNNDTVLTSRWIDPLVDALSQPGVAACGPRSNFVSGDQVVSEAVYRTRHELIKFSRQWCRDHRGETSPTERLVGFCLAVDRSVFEAVGGFDESYGIGGFEDDDLCRRILAAGHRMVICHDSFVHHEGHKSFDANGLDWLSIQESNKDLFLGKVADRALPGKLVSACIITKDEEENLASCLRSLSGFADEIIVYDTGSSDSTVDIAESMGAQVIRGYWDDDFSRARNEALSHCRGEWIAWLDADETLDADPEQLRDSLAGAPPGVAGFSVPIHNLVATEAESAIIHYGPRLFRRMLGRWSGRLHEQVVNRRTGAPLVKGRIDTVRILHRGYLPEVLDQRSKAERNRRLAQVEVDSTSGDARAYALTSLGRSLSMSGRYEEAIDRLCESLDETSAPVTRQIAMNSIVENLTALDRLDEALEWCERLRSEGAGVARVNALEASVRAKRKEWTDVVRLLEGITVRDFEVDAYGLRAGAVTVRLATALAELGRYEEAADRLASSLSEEEVLDTHLGVVIDYFIRAGRPLEALASSIPNHKSSIFLAQLLQLPDPRRADDFLEAAFASENLGQMPVLATASKLAQHLPVERALVWSSRIRAAGHPESCPLLLTAKQEGPPVLRARAAATAAAAFSDLQAESIFKQAYEGATFLEQQLIESEARQLCPRLLMGRASRVALPTSRLSDLRPKDALRASIIIPCFNRADMTLQCLRSLNETTNPSLYEIVLVDNGSADLTRELSNSSDDRMRVLRHQTNVGFARGCNSGAALARADVLVFLNNDTVPHYGWLEALLQDLEQDPQLGVVGSRLLFPDGTVQHAGVGVGTDNEGLLHGYHLHYRRPQDFPLALEPSEVPAVTGAALAVRKTVFEEVGHFCELYWNGNEDVDLCLSVREAGYRILYESRSVLTHFESQSGPERFTGYGANVALLNERWAHKYRSIISPTNPDRLARL